MIHFASPWVLGFVALVPLWLWWRRRELHARAIAFPPLEHVAVSARAGGGVGLLLFVEALVLTVAVAALAGPERVMTLERIDEDGIDLALVLDISASMQAADFPPNRLEALKRLAIELVRRSAGHRIGVYAFAGFPVTQTPFTTDGNALAELIDGLAYESIVHDTKGGGTAIGDALLVATDDLKKIKVEGRDQMIVLVTDGENNMGFDPLLAARQIGERQLRFFVIGIGQEKPIKVWVNGKPFLDTQDRQLETSLDDRQLREIARLGHGTYRRADRDAVLADVFDEIVHLNHRPYLRRNVTREVALAPRAAVVLFGLLALWLALDGLYLRRPFR